MIADGWAVFKIHKTRLLYTLSEHYLIHDGTKILCGMGYKKHKIVSTKTRGEKLRCGLCEKILPNYLQNGRQTNKELIARLEDERLETILVKSPEFRFKDDYLIISSGVKCSQPGCPETGGTIIKNNETVNSKPHYCIKHNPTIRLLASPSLSRPQKRSTP